MEAAFFCDECRRDGDEPIADSAVFRRVSVNLVVYLSATSLVPRLAQTEAVARLERAIEAAGGVVNLLQVSSAAGSLAPHAEPAGVRAGRGRVE